MTEKPFVHKKAFTNVKCNFIFHDEFIKILLKVLKFKGILNIGGKSQTIFQFAKKYKKNVKRKVSNGELPSKIYMSLDKVNRLLEK
jgi:dTDP-4-dehydrorhamnose reductase